MPQGICRVRVVTELVVHLQLTVRECLLRLYTSLNIFDLATG